MFVLPVVILASLGFAIVGIFGFFFMGIKAVRLFFKGKSFDNELEEDIKADKLMNPEKYKKNPEGQNIAGKEVVEVTNNRAYADDRRYDQPVPTSQPQIFIITPGQNGQFVSNQYIGQQIQQDSTYPSSEPQQIDMTQSEVSLTSPQHSAELENNDINQGHKRINPYASQSTNSEETHISSDILISKDMYSGDDISKMKQIEQPQNTINEETKTADSGFKKYIPRRGE